jgi:NAD(P)-dependent dehydrogenase (short-subunit alcohol dehydrogenase family)
MALRNRIALVTGADGGIGTDVTRVLLDGGATVIGVFTNIQPSSSDSFVALSSDLSTGNLWGRTLRKLVVPC